MTIGSEESKSAGERRRRLFPRATDAQWNDWHWQLQQAVTSVESVLKYVGRDYNEAERTELARVVEKYPVIIPPYYLCLVNLEDARDPIRVQAFPVPEEIAFHVVGEPDPLEEEEDMSVPGLVHRYPDRVLVQITNLCPMNCRHCTRKREWEEGVWMRSESEIDAMVKYVADTPQVRDVLFSGGDPLVLSTPKLEAILKRFREIPHVEILRIGTRFPVVLPQRIDEELTAMLRRHRPLWVNTHFNHPNEITLEAARACDLLQCAGMPMNNQTVLMKNVNDSVPVMTDLCHRLLAIGVRPYYLYQCDPVRGAEHLRTSVWKGIEIIEGMRGHTTGFAVPTFVVDAPGGGGKIPLSPNYLLSESEEELMFRNYEGLVVCYKNPSASDRTEVTKIRERSFLSNERLARRARHHENRPHSQSEKRYHGQRFAT